MRAMSCGCIAAAIVMSALSTGCSLFAGPTRNAKAPEPSDIDGKADTDWTSFATIEQAQSRLRGAARFFRDRASTVAKSNEVGSDLSVSSLIAGSIAGATGSEQGALIGGGLASLVGIGFDRYKLTTQRDNMVKAASAYACVEEAISGISSAMLKVPVVAGDEPDPNLLNERRVTLVSDIGRTARQIQAAFEKAQRDVTLVQPNLPALESAIKGEKEQTTKYTRSALQSIAFRTSGAALTRGSRHQMLVNSVDLEVVRREIRTLREARDLTALQLDQEETKGSKKDAKVVSRLQAAIETLDAQISQKHDAIGKALADAWVDPTGADEHLLLVTRLSTITEKLEKCKALVQG